MAARRWIAGLAVAGCLGAVALGGAAWWLWPSSDASANAAIETLPVDRGDVVAKVSASGTLSALVTVQVGAQVSGRVAELHADFNSHVTKGQVLLKLDPQLYEAALEQARANTVAAEGNLAKVQAQSVDAARQADRAATLAARQLVATADADTARSTADAAAAAVRAAQGQVAQARASQHQAEVNLGYTTVLSPIDGVVISRSVDVGQSVAASLSAPTLFVIAQDLSQMQVDTSVGEADIGKLSPGSAAQFTVDAWPSVPFTGVVRQVRNAATTVQNVVTYDAVVDVANPDGKLRPGMTANVSFLYATREDVLRVPNAALRFRAPASFAGDAGAGGNGDGNGGNGDGKGGKGAGRRRGGDGAGGAGGAGGGLPSAEGDPRSVWRLVDGKPEKVAIRAGLTDGSFTEVVSGDLKEGDALIIFAPDPDADAKSGSGGAKPSGGGSNAFRRGL